MYDCRGAGGLLRSGGATLRCLRGIWKDSMQVGRFQGGGSPGSGHNASVVGRALADSTGVWPTTSVQPRMATGSMGAKGRESIQQTT